MSVGIKAERINRALVRRRNTSSLTSSGVAFAVVEVDSDQTVAAWATGRYFLELPDCRRVIESVQPAAKQSRSSV